MTMTKIRPCPECGLIKPVNNDVGVCADCVGDGR